MTRDNFCSYKLSMLGRQMIKQYIVHERRRYIRKLWGSVFWFALFTGLTLVCFTPSLLARIPYGEYLPELAPFFVLFGLVSLFAFIMLLHSGYKRQLSRRSDLNVIKHGGYKVDTMFVAGAYRPRGRGFGSTALKSLLEGHKDYAIGTVEGRQVHALNLTGDLIDNAYRPCLTLDNSSVFILHRTAVVAPKKKGK